MLEDHPVLKDRLQALGVFSGIAIAAVAGFELVITGGFDPITPGQEIRAVAPSSYVRVEHTMWSPETRLVALSSNEPAFAGDDTPASAEDLDGGADAPAGGSPQAQSEDDLYAQIEALYARQDARAYEPQPYAETPPAQSGKALSASGSASPW